MTGRGARDGIEAQHGLNDVFPGDPYPGSPDEPQARTWGGPDDRRSSTPAGGIFAEGAPPSFDRGDVVRKTEGYAFPGVVLWSGPKTDGRVIVLVECTAPDVAGMVHVFSPRQLEHDR